MKILESPLIGEFIGFLKSNWDGHSRVSKHRHRLEQLVAMVRGVTDSAEARTAVQGSSLYSWLQLLRTEALRGQAVLDAISDPSAVAGSEKYLAGVKALFLCSAEVDRLTNAVDALEQLKGPGADLDIFLKVLQLQLDDAANAVDVNRSVAVAMAMARVRRRIGRPSLGRPFARISLSEHQKPFSSILL